MVNAISPKHPVPQFLDAGLPEELPEQLHGFGRNAVFGVIEEEVMPTVRKVFGPFGILGKEIAHGWQVTGMAGQCSPGRKIDRSGHPTTLGEGLGRGKVISIRLSSVTDWRKIRHA